MKRFFLVILLTVFLLGFNSIAYTLEPQPYEANIRQTLYLLNPLTTERALKLLNVLDKFDLLDISIKIPEKSIDIKYSASTVNLAALINAVNKMGYTIIRVK